MRLGGRITEALRAARRAVRAAELARAGIDPARIDVPELRPQSLGALVVGLSAVEIAGLAPEIRAAVSPADAFVVLMTDVTDIAAFQMEGFVTEYLAPARVLAEAAPGRNPDLYSARRLGLICGKWNLRSVLLFGQTAQRLAERCGRCGTHLPSGPFAPGGGCSRLQGNPASC